MKLRSILVLLLAPGLAHGAGLRLHADLSGAHVVSATDSTASGEATAVLEGNRLRLNLVFGGLASDVTGAALHTGTTAENGPAVAPLDVRRNRTVGSLVDESLDLGPEVAARVRAGEAYIEVSTVDHPQGAIRGQLLPQPVRLGDQVEEEEEGD